MSRLARAALSALFLGSASIASAGPITPAPATPAAAVSASEKIRTVRYSYEAWSRSGKKRFVLVPVPTEVKGGSLKDRTNEVFKALVNDKRGSYGDARVAFQPDAEKTQEVYVYLDATKPDYHPIVMAETVYAFTENGAVRVRFPKVVDAGWTRADVSTPAYVMTISLHEALPPNGIAGTIVQLPDGSLLPQAIVVERLLKKDKLLVDSVWALTSTSTAGATLAVIEAAPLLDLPELESKLIGLLQSANSQLRKAAMGGLSKRDNATVNAALRKVMDEDPDAAVRDGAAAVLSVSKDPSFSTAAQYHALKSADPAIVGAAAKSLGESKQPEATEQLVGVLGHVDPTARSMAVASLQKRGDYPALSARLGETKLSVEHRTEIALALSIGADKDSELVGLCFLAVSATGPAATTAASALTKWAKLDRAKAFESLGMALSHADPQTRIAAANALGDTAQAKALPLLSKAKVDDEVSGASAMDAMRRIYAAQPAEFVLKESKSGDPVLRRVAVATLGELLKNGKKWDRKAIIEALRVLAGDGKADIRAAATRSFGDLAADEVRPDVVALAADKAIEVQRAAAFALRAFPGKDAVKLLLLFAQKADSELLANALDSLGILKEKEAIDPVVAHLNDEDVRVRRASTSALVRIGGELPIDKRNPLLSFFSERLFDRDTEVRLRALEGLGLVKDKRVVSAMAALLQDQVPEVRTATLLAMAKTGDLSAVEAIASGLEDDDLSVRRAALEAFLRLKKKEAVVPLSAYVKKEKDKALSDEATKVISQLNKGS